MKFVAAASAFCVLSASAFAPQRVSRAAVSVENHYCCEGEAPHLFVLLSTTSDVMKVCDRRDVITIVPSCDHESMGVDTKRRVLPTPSMLRVFHSTHALITSCQYLLLTPCCPHAPRAPFTKTRPRSVHGAPHLPHLPQRTHPRSVHSVLLLPLLPHHLPQ